ncbi:MAG: cyclase family protein [Firmicutes bacterium]|nr:cyclase family protein [Bacillota bacterium]
MIDISRSVGYETEIYPKDPEFSIERVYSLKNGDGFNVSRIVLGSHMSTHIDSPAHFFDEKKAVDALDINVICGKVIVVTATCDVDRSFIEKTGVKRGERLVLRTGGEFGVTCEGAACAAERGLALIGTDSMDIETAADTKYIAHKILLGNDIPILEFLDLRNVSDGVYRLICLPLKIEGADAVPVRAVLEKM